MTIFILAVLVWFGVSAADALTTLKVLALGGTENNPLLGKNPTPKTVWVFAGVTSVAFAAIAMFIAVPTSGYGPAATFLAVGSVIRAIAVGINLKARKLLLSRTK